jgi:hypothetical protein
MVCGLSVELEGAIDLMIHSSQRLSSPPTTRLWRAVPPPRAGEGLACSIDARLSGLTDACSPNDAPDRSQLTGLEMAS